MAYRSLSADEVAELKAQTRQAGVYAAVVKEFADSGDSGADVTESFPGRKLKSAQAQLKRILNKDEFSGIDVIYTNQDGTERLALVRQ